MKKAYFACGCFWCIVPVFRALPGVIDIISGYSGGAEVDPTYEEVKKQQTGHRETVCITYDEKKIGYPELIDTFLKYTDPFDDGGQFIDRGFSYTLAVYFETEEERACARGNFDVLEAESGMKTAIALERFTAFYTAEEYHQNYDLKNPEAFREELETSGRSKRNSCEF